LFGQCSWEWVYLHRTSTKFVRLSAK
jgi:hypothetical protein